ncbi:hypothetical protein AYI69_g5885 [Smittium culicis]|uniref:Uncharacterized protein n=1 Tax=Smittium culicis TaxID=133412 RepID=A0A1R1Y3B1_9FUNG|nr:hypothetical protein AYI69_g5885 [Smittium culicis]
MMSSKGLTSFIGKFKKFQLSSGSTKIWNSTANLTKWKILNLIFWRYHMKKWNVQSLLLEKPKSRFFKCERTAWRIFNGKNSHLDI